MTHIEIRRRFINFFVKNDHLQIPSANLVARGDPTLLFINSGMAAIKPYFTGEEKPPHPRLTDIQKCLRTEDLESVGDPHHHTFFEMLGSWSIGDYGKETAVRLAWELLTSSQGFGFDPQRLYVTVFAGNDYLPADDETAKYWESLGVLKDHILRLPAEDNLWVSGPTGPCGPCTEVLYDRGEEYSCGPNCNPTCSCGRFYEIWNAGVFMQYFRKSETEFDDLPFLSVDTGAGLERLAAVLQGRDSNYETDLFSPIVTEVASGLNLSQLSPRQMASVRIISDHLRAAFFLIADGVVPSNKQEGYVLRRLLRRAMTHGVLFKIDQIGLFQRLSPVMAGIYAEFYPEVENPKIVQIMQEEYQSFLKTLKKGLNILREKIDLLGETEKGEEQVLPGELVFDLESTYGLPFDTQKDFAENFGIKIDQKGYQEAFKKHQELSRRGAEGKFGKVGEYPPEQIAPLHTATHLLHQALRDVLGEEIRQAGQSLTPERLRFDFTFDRKLTPQELSAVEAIVNEKIDRQLPVIKKKTSYHQAVKEGAIALFREKYKQVDEVTMYEIGDYSKELCGGPHVANTAELGRFKIVKEESVGKGVRRIKAVLERN
ncbi:alanine--tRNA ligase [candidate division CPR3 bacterium 4484_211]|uniref:Alanine--tRNA ligase n=1 Tax=candidate division CPR3 bacterium 4484_211 TaxID=1968527 RepID=A0A1W9NYF3_UNCC3|nr:MAG: alanine--tRNA ligase [candidate division CPR3 bacterium 4484_211]